MALGLERGAAATLNASYHIMSSLTRSEWPSLTCLMFTVIRRGCLSAEKFVSQMLIHEPRHQWFRF
jgi:hypothetical protein